jgi:multiple sugar transport system permease protein
MRHAKEEPVLLKIVLDALLVVLFLAILFPFVWIVLGSFKTETDILAWPPKFLFPPTLDHFRNILSGVTYELGKASLQSNIDIVGFFFNSLIVSCGAIVVSLLVGVPAAYAIARFKFRGRENIAFTLLSFRFAPALMIIIPLYIIFRKLGLNNTYIGLIWVYQLITLPMIVWILRGYIEDISPELEEACLVDGYSQWRTFWRVTLPLARPGVVAAALLAFIYAWNNFLFGLILGGTHVQPITMGALQFISTAYVRYGDISATIVLAFIPALALSIYSQRHLIRGLSFGAVKA